MNRTWVVGVSACAAAGFLLAWFAREPAAAREKPAPSAPQWEYKFVHKPVSFLTDKEAGAQFNKLGARGWEMCGTVSLTSNRVPWGVFVFKRPRR